MADLQRLASRSRRAFLRHRRLLAAGAAAASVVTAVQIFAPPPPATTALAVASRDLDAGVVLTTQDIRVVEVPPELVPGGAADADQIVGETVAAPMRAGEPLTDRRIVGAALVAGYATGFVATPVRIQDADVVALLRVGDHIDLYASAADAGETAVRVVNMAPVVLLPEPGEDNRDGALVVLAVTPDDAARLAQASAMSQLSLSLRS